MIRRPLGRAIETTPGGLADSPWLDGETASLLAFRTWKRNVPECFRPDRWRARIADAVHFRSAMRAVSPPAYKLLYDSYVWSRALASFLGWGPACDVLELLPGRSLTVPVALQTLGFRGRLHRADFAPQGTLPRGFDFATTWQPGNVLALEVAPARVVLGNHILDDMIATLHYGPTDFFTKIYGNPVAERAAWAAIANSRSLSDSISEVVRFFRWLFLMPPGVVLMILREYPATVAILHTNVEHVAVHSACYSALIAECRGLKGVSVQHPEPVGDDIPMGSRHPRSFLIVRRDPEQLSPPIPVTGSAAANGSGGLGRGLEPE